MDTFIKTTFLIAITLTGILCGASLDQSIKQLPARHRIGMKTFSAYAKAADLKNGVIWYATLGIGSAVTALVTALLIWRQDQLNIGTPIYLAALFGICHSICTLLAAPTYFKQKNVQDEVSLQRLFNKFELISAIRSIFISLNFCCYIWSLMIMI